MRQYHKLLKHVLENGTDKNDRTGTGTRSVFGYQMRFDLSKGLRYLIDTEVKILDEDLKYLNATEIKELFNVVT